MPVYVVRTETASHGLPSAAAAYARLRELQRRGCVVTVTDSAGRPLDASRLQAIADIERLPGA